MNKDFQKGVIFMVKTKLFKAACIVLAAGTICIIPANVMEASRTPVDVAGNTSTQKMKKKVTAKNKVTVKKKENSVVINTSLSEKDQEKLFKQYKKYDIVKIKKYAVLPIFTVCRL